MVTRDLPRRRSRRAASSTVFAGGPRRWRRPCAARSHLHGLRTRRTVCAARRRRIGRGGARFLVERISQVGLKRVVADVKDTAGLPLVPSTPVENEADVPAAPCTQRLASLEGGYQRGCVVAADGHRQIVQ